MSALSTAASTAARTTTAPQRYVIDLSHSSVGFSVRHLMITNVKGEFEKFAGEVHYDPRAPEATKVSATIEVASINTREAKRDAHLCSADFFDAEKFPTLEFASKRVAKKDEGLEVVGDLTIHGTTREVVLSVSDVTAEHNDPWGNRRIGASAKTKVRRSEFGMQWNAALEAGGVLIGDEVTISIDVSLVAAPSADA